jgi:hypothetical protein
MIDGSEARLEALITIVDYSLADVLSNLYKNHTMPICLLTHGYGSATSVIYDSLYHRLKQHWQCSFYNL